MVPPSSSARGLLRVEREDNRYVLHEMQTWEQENQGELRPVFCDGAMLTLTTLADIRARLLG